MSPAWGRAKATNNDLNHFVGVENREAFGVHEAASQARYERTQRKTVENLTVANAMRMQLFLAQLLTEPKKAYGWTYSL